MKKKILLTGASGFIGKNIKQSYLSEIYEFYTPSHLELDLTDRAAVGVYLKNSDFDLVIHAAAKAGHRNSKDCSALLYNNMLMFENLALYSDRYQKFINIGSGAIYDTSSDIVRAKEVEQYLNIPSDELGFCKYLQMKRIDGLANFVNLNLFGVYGPYEDWQIRFISNAICKSLMKMPVTLRQNRRFSYLYIDDLMPILEYFIENELKYNSYNIVPDKSVELLELARIVQMKCENNNQILVAQSGLGREYTGDNARLKDEVLVNFTDIEVAVEKLIKYYNANLNLIDKELLLYDK